MFPFHPFHLRCLSLYNFGEKAYATIIENQHLMDNKNGGNELHPLQTCFSFNLPEAGI